MEIIVKAKLPISESDMRDIICNGYEGGIGYWYCSTDVERKEYDYISITGVDAEIAMDHDTIAQIEGAHIDEHGELWVINAETIKLGIERVFEKHTHNAELIKALLEGDIGMIDAEGADVIIQLGIFGEVIYG